MDVLESFSQSYHQSRGAGYDPASWRVIALLVGGELRWWLFAWLMRGSGIGSSFIGLINSRLSAPDTGDCPNWNTKTSFPAPPVRVS